MIKIFILLMQMLLAYSLQELYNLVLHTQKRGAACLDGSPPGLYISEGKGANLTKFMIYFQGGGLCGGISMQQTLQSCYERSQTDLGSTKNYPSKKSFLHKGLLSPSKEQNPAFYDWTKVFVIYCDGAAHSGYHQQPITYKNASLYFRGNRNTIEQFLYLDENYDFYNSDLIVITGFSAGGMATYLWTNYLYDNTKKAQILTIPDSGFFITDFYSEMVGVQLQKVASYYLLSILNASSEMPSPVMQCLSNTNLSLIDCFNVVNYFQYLKAPVFIIQSPYDAYSMYYAVAAKCDVGNQQPFSMQHCDKKSKIEIEKYRQATIQLMRNMKSNRSDVGLWSPACIQHGFSDSPSFSSNNYLVKGVRLADAIQQFISDPTHALWLQDQLPWPSNIGCSGLISIKHKK